MGMEEASQWAMGIVMIIGMCMMLNMRRCPLVCRPLKGHRSQNKEHKTHSRMRLKAPMGQHAMETNRDPKRGQDVEHNHNRYFAPCNQLLPECPDRNEYGNERHNNADNNSGFFDWAFLHGPVCL